MRHKNDAIDVFIFGKAQDFCGRLNVQNLGLDLVVLDELFEGVQQFFARFLLYVWQVIRRCEVARNRLDHGDRIMARSGLDKAVAISIAL